MIFRGVAYFYFAVLLCASSEAAVAQQIDVAPVDSPSTADARAISPEPSIAEPSATAVDAFPAAVTPAATADAAAPVISTTTDAEAPSPDVPAAIPSDMNDPDTRAPVAPAAPPAPPVSPFAVSPDNLPEIAFIRLDAAGQPYSIYSTHFAVDGRFPQSEVNRLMVGRTMRQGRVATDELHRCAAGYRFFLHYAANFPYRTWEIDLKTKPATAFVCANDIAELIPTAMAMCRAQNDSRLCTTDGHARGLGFRFVWGDNVLDPNRGAALRIWGECINDGAVTGLSEGGNCKILFKDSQAAEAEYAAMTAPAKLYIYAIISNYGGRASNFRGYTSVVGVRAHSPEEAEAKIQKQRPYRSARALDNGKCTSGYYLIGYNQYDERAAYGVPAVFVACNFATLDELIERGILESGKTFFHYKIGKVEGPASYLDPDGPYCRVDPQTRRWQDGITSIDGTTGGHTASIPFCEKLNVENPILVDREPQETILITP